MSQDRFQRLISSDRLSGSWEGRGIKKALTAIGPRVTFQSSPAPKGRCYSRFMIGVIIRYLFQSSPAPKGRCYANELERAIQKVVVSILTGPEGPVLPRHTDGGQLCFQFQSSPAPKGRCYHPARAVGVPKRRSQFQSSPAPKGRCYLWLSPWWLTVMCFNPHRPRRAGATQFPDRPTTGHPVSILTGPEGPVLRVGQRQRRTPDEFQSSPAPKGRCYP